MSDRTRRLAKTGGSEEAEPTYKTGGHRANGPAPDIRR